MRTLWWRLAVIGTAAAIILFGVGSLKIGTDQAHVSRESAATTKLGEEPEQAWEASSGMRNELTDGTVGSVDTVIGAARGPYRESRLTQSSLP